ncbi:MAG: hypothetical protein P1U70_26085, partial [Saprospiraceae bacterium]|nr:hypothetical protein [Saprospiraceae bacterium]
MTILKLARQKNISAWFQKSLFIDKLNNPLGYCIMIACAIGLAYIMSILPIKFSVLVIAALVGIPLIIYSFINLHFGIIVMLCIAFFLGLAAKHTNSPIGTSMDGMLLIMLFGLLVRLVKERDFKFIKSPITVFILAWIYYNIVQVINPWAESRLAWVYTVRSVALLLCLYFIACYAFNNLKRILTIIKLIVLLTFLAAAYSLKQEFLGFNNAEIAWLYADPERFQLIYQWGRLRVFSFFSDPTTFGILMGYMGIFCFILAAGPYKIWQKIALALAGLCMMMGMAYAGSRTPFVLVPLGVDSILSLTVSAW